MKKHDKFFIAATVLLTGLLLGVVGQNMQPETVVSPVVKNRIGAPSGSDIEAIKKNLTAAGIVLHEARYWRELPAN